MNRRDILKNPGLGAAIMPVHEDLPRVHGKIKVWAYLAGRMLRPIQ